VSKSVIVYVKLSLMTIVMLMLNASAIYFDADATTGERPPRPLLRKLAQIGY
jgi:hypothetical protein